MEKSWAGTWPIRAGKSDSWKKFTQELSGKRKIEFEKFMKDSGIARTKMWSQRSPEGEWGMIMWEGNNPTQFWNEMNKWSRTNEFGKWFAGQMKDIHGWDISTWDSKKWNWEIGADIWE